MSWGSNEVVVASMITSSIRGRRPAVIEGGSDEPPGCGADEAESDVAADVVSKGGEVVLDRSEFADHSPGTVGDNLAFGGEFTAGAVDEG